MDGHKETVAVCVLTPGPGAEPNKEIRPFGTPTGELRRRRDWRRESGVTPGAMESTGVYGKPGFNILERAGPIIRVNARQVKPGPGRQTAQADGAWIASLLRQGLLQASFGPELEVRELRDRGRMRTTLGRECVQVGNRRRKVLEEAHIKLDSVASNALGVAGRDLIGALVQGREDPAELAELARGRRRAKRPELEQAREGPLPAHPRFLLRELRRQRAFLEGPVARFEKQIERHRPSFEGAAGRLLTRPGVDRTAAGALLAEIGADRSRFASSRRRASWAGRCPGNNESAGKRRSGNSPRGHRWIKGRRREIAWAASRQKDSYRRAQYRQRAGHRGKKRARGAVANSLRQAAGTLRTKRQSYQDLGADYHERLNRKDLERSLVRRLEKLGRKVILPDVA